MSGLHQIFECIMVFHKFTNESDNSSIIIILSYMPFRSPGTHASNHTFTPGCPPDILTNSEAIIARGKPTGLNISLLSITLYTNTDQCFKSKRHNIRHCISLLIIKKLICSCTRENTSYWIWLHKQPGNKSSKQLKKCFPKLLNDNYNRRIFLFSFLIKMLTKISL